MLDRLRITQRLGLLLLLPLGAVVLTSVPFVATQVDATRAASIVLDVATKANDASRLIQELQQERLLALTYLASSRLDTQALRVAVSNVDDRAAAFERNRGTRVTQLETIEILRPHIFDRTAATSSVLTSYHRAVVDLIDGLGLTSRTGMDALGTRQMSELDSLLRANEESAQLGVVLVLTSIDSVTASALAGATASREQVYLAAFRQSADPEHAHLLSTVEDGPTSRNTQRLVDRVLGEAGARLPVDQALSVAQAGIDLRRILQERIAREVAQRASANASQATISATVGAGVAFGLLLVVIWLGTAVGRSVSAPLQRLTVAAATVADLASQELVRVGDSDAEDAGPPRLAAVNIRTEDEIGELASAFNRVQATAALLMEQQIVTRRNVAVMFANVARRTRGLVSRQMSWIDDLEHDERDAARLGKLYQLDHVTMRLRRSAASLLVIAGSRNEEAVSSVATLPDIVRSAVAEIEGYQNVHIGQVDAVAINSSLVADLTLLLAEVLENATSFSPPQVLVTVDAQVYAEGCLIRVVDQGIGMTAARMAEENERIEMRERLDVMPTAVLGLFVVGRIARRHGMSVQLRPTAGTGVTVDITVPRSLLQAVPMAQPVIPAMPVAAAAPVIDARERFEGRARVRPPAEPQPVGESRGGLRRRERPGDAPAVPEPIAARGPVVRDPEAERAGLNAFERQFARGAQQQSEFAARYASGGQSGVQMHNATRADAGMTPGGLRRRRPGEHLAAELRELSPSDRRRPDLRPDYRLPARDAEAERAALADYSAGLARAPRHNAIRSDFDWSRG